MDLVVISTTLDKDISIKRRNNLFTKFSKFGVPILFNYAQPINDRSDVAFASFLNILCALQTFKKTKYEYAIICEDDFEPHPDFANELSKTINLLDPDWRCLHLSPGYLWGRLFHHNLPIGTLYPEGDIGDLQVHDSGRFFINCRPDVLTHKLLWLGGPVTFVVNQKNVDDFINDFKQTFLANHENNDVILVKMLKPNDYICREPLLGRENEQGGSTWMLKTDS